MYARTFSAVSLRFKERGRNLENKKGSRVRQVNTKILGVHVWIRAHVPSPGLESLDS